MRTKFKDAGSILCRKKPVGGAVFQRKGTSGNREGFRQASLEEDPRELRNPGIGWYHVYTFVLERSGTRQPVEEETWLDASCKTEELALVLIDIGDFRTCPLSREALAHIRDILEFFRRHKKQMILRFVYDREGKAKGREPEDLDQVMEHMEQTGVILQDYVSHILVVQGIFVGNWGEMHGSAFSGEEAMCELLNCLYRAMGGNCFLAVRTPDQWRHVAACRWLAQGLTEKLGLFNDGIFGSVTDLGTYGAEGGKRERLRELGWQERHMGRTPNGGEVLLGQVPPSWGQAAGELGQMHVSYLNSVYQKELLDLWKEEQVEKAGCWQGASGYSYIGSHLGYRFWVREAWVKKDCLYVTVENCGFANLCQEAECFLVTEEPLWDKEESSRYPGYRLLDTDARTWESGCRTTIVCQLQEEEKDGRLYLHLRRKEDHRVILFANQGAGDSVLLGQFADG